MAARELISRRAAVLGRPIGHSLSPALHKAAHRALGLDGWEYEAQECDEAGLPALLARLDDSWQGLSLTMPLKRAIIPLLTRVSPLAAGVGAVNTVTWTDAREPVGDNTDVYGIVAALAEGGVTGAGASGAGGNAGTGATAGPGAGVAVVVGGGATASSAIAALRELGFEEPLVQVRSAARAADLMAAAERLGVRPVLTGLDDASALHAVLTADIVICTLPAEGNAAWAERLLREGPARRPLGVLLDVAYDPWPTPVARVWTEAGGRVVGGFGMLLHQAAAQVRLMTGLEPPVAAMRAAGLAELARRSVLSRTAP